MDSDDFQRELRKFYGFTGLFSNKQAGTWYYSGYIVVGLLLLFGLICLPFYLLAEKLGLVEKEPVRTAEEIELTERERELDEWEISLAIGDFDGKNIKNPIKRRLRLEKEKEELKQARIELEKEKEALRHKLSAKHKDKSNVKNQKAGSAKTIKPSQKKELLSVENLYDIPFEEQKIESGNTMNKTELVKEISKNANLSKSKAKLTVDSFQKVIATTLKKNESVHLENFGTFSVIKRKAIHHSLNDNKIKTSAFKQPRFIADEELKKALN